MGEMYDPEVKLHVSAEPFAHAPGVRVIFNEKDGAEAAIEALRETLVAQVNRRLAEQVEKWEALEKRAPKLLPADELHWLAIGLHHVADRLEALEALAPLVDDEDDDGDREPEPDPSASATD